MIRSSPPSITTVHLHHRFFFKTGQSGFLCGRGQMADRAHAARVGAVAIPTSSPSHRYPVISGVPQVFRNTSLPGSHNLNFKLSWLAPTFTLLLYPSLTMSLSSHASRKGYKRENSPNLLPTPGDWVTIHDRCHVMLAHAHIGVCSIFTQKWDIGQGTHIHVQFFCCLLILPLQFSLSPDPALWGSNLSPNLVEADDGLHNPEFVGGKLVDRPSSGIITRRGIANLGCLTILTLGLVALLFVHARANRYPTHPGFYQCWVPSYHFCTKDIIVDRN